MSTQPVVLASAALAPTRLVPVGAGLSEDAQRQVIRTPEGRVYIVAADDGGDLGNVCRLRMYAGDRPGVPSAFHEITASTAPTCTLGTRVSGGDARLDRKGTIWIAWFRVDHEAAAVTSFDTRTNRWGPTSQVTTRTDAYAEHAGRGGLTVTALTLGADDRPVVAVSRQDGLGIWQLYGTSWRRTAVIDAQADDGHGIWHPSLSRDRRYGMHVAWERVDPTTQIEQVRYANRPNGGRWSAPQVVAQGDVLGYVDGLDEPDQGPSLTVDSAARPVVTWVDAQDGTHVATLIGGSWRDQGPSGPPFSHDPSVMLSGDRRLLLLGHDARIHPAWTTSAGLGKPWSPVTELAPPSGTKIWQYDGSASSRDDPAYDTDCHVLDTLFMNEDSATRSPGTYQSDLYYAAFRVSAPRAGC